MHVAHLRTILSRALGNDRAIRVMVLGPGAGAVEAGPMRPPDDGQMMGIHMGLMRGMPLRGASFLVQVQLQDGSWLSLTQRLPEGPFTWPHKLLLTLAVLLVSVIALSLLAVRWLTRPLEC